MSDDKRLQRAVIDRLAIEPGLDAARIGVTVADGVVTLHGTAGDFAQKLRAEYAAEEVRGVRAVVDELVLRSGAHTHRDDDIVAAALRALASDPTLHSDRIKIRVEDGWVTLDGDVPTERERQAARRALRHLFGLRGLSNQLRVHPRPHPLPVPPSMRAHDAVRD